MKLIQNFEFNGEEICSILHYALIVSVMGGAYWNTGTNKRRLAENFNEEELEKINKIYKKCRKWYVGTGVPETIILEAEVYTLWLKLYTYIVRYFSA